jgi:hypothetical protein
MKTQLLILSLFAAPVCLSAQPVMQRENMAPIGFNAVLSVGAGVDPGPTGPNQTWDFSGTDLAVFGTFSLVDPASTPYVTLVPTSNYCYKVSPTSGDAIYDYYNLLPGSMPKMAQGMSSTTGEIFTDPKIDLIFPFNYGDSYFDEFAKTNGGTGSVTKTYDAYGTLITPDKTYQNVVRIHTVWDDDEWEYQWWDSQAGHLVWSVTIEGSRALSSDNTGIAENVKTSTGLFLAPNPARDNCRIMNTDTPLKDIQLINPAGQVAARFEGNRNNFDVSTLARGFYTACITLESGRIITRKLSVE